MPSRVWLSVAFVLAFGASPAQAGTHRAAPAVLAASSSDGATAAAQDADPASLAEPGGHNGVAE